MKKKTIWIGAGALATVLVIGGVGVAVAEPFGDDDDLSGATLDDATTAALAEVGDGQVTSAERSDDAGYAYEVEVTRADGRQIEVELDEDFRIVRVDDDGAGNDDRSGAQGGRDQDPSGDSGPAGTPSAEDDASISESELADASAAALTEVGDGEVVDVDREDDADHAWEVDVVRADGTRVEVELGTDFDVIRVVEQTTGR